MTAARLPFSVLLAIVVNVLLFAFVMKMVTGERRLLQAVDDNVSLVNFVRLEREPQQVKMNRRERLPERPPPPPRAPPPKMAPQQVQQAPPPPMQMPVPDINVPLRIAGGPNLGEVVPAPAAAPTPAPVSAPAGEGPPAPAAELETNLVPTYRAPPTYPPRALRGGIEGVVTVEFIIAADGSVKDPKIIKSEPPEVFDEAVMRAILKWKFNPKLVDGRPVERRARQDVRFSLNKH